MNSMLRWSVTRRVGSVERGVRDDGTSGVVVGGEEVEEHMEDRGIRRKRMMEAVLRWEYGLDSIDAFEARRW